MKTSETSTELRSKAVRYRTMATLVTDQPLADMLLELADQYEETANQMEPRQMDTQALQN